MISPQLHKLLTTGAVVAALSVAACATPQTPAQTVYVIETDFAASLAIAAAYHDLPVCPTAVLCKDPTTLVRIQAATLAAGNAIATVQSIVRANGDPTAAMTIAQQAVAALQSLTAALKVK